MRNSIIKIIVVTLIASLVLPLALSASAIGSLNVDINKGASVSSSSVNSTYNSTVNKVNSAVNSANSKISQLYDLNFELIDFYKSQAQSKLNELNAIKTQLINKISSNASSTEINNLVNQFNSTVSTVEALCQSLEMCLTDSKIVSARSTWYRPCEGTFSQIKENVEMFKRIGINLIFLETFYHGMSAFKSDISDIPYHTSLASTYTDNENNIVYNDYLSAFVACCVENGIEVHAWVENFYVGINANAHIIKQHPDWIMYNDDGTMTQRKEGGAYIFIDPANEEVQNLLINYYNELFKKHPEVKGLNLDYIRYPVSNRSLDTGYGVAAMKGFYESLGKTFTSAQLASRDKMANKFEELFNKNYLIGGQTEADSNYQKWVAYRTQVITDFVCRIKTEVKEPNGIVLSTAVFASLSDSLDNKKQDWKTWFNNGWIEIATPMAYYTTSSAVNSNVKTMIKNGGEKCLYYTGIASSYSGLPAKENKAFIEASYSAGACGYVIFSGAQIVGHTDVQDVLSSGVNYKTAVLPHAKINLILSASFEDILSKAERLYIPAGGMTAASQSALEDEFDKIMEMPDTTNEDIEAIYQAVLQILNNVKNYASGYSQQRMSEDLDYLADILKSRASMPIFVDDDINDDDIGDDNINDDVNDDDNIDDDITGDDVVDEEIENEDNNTSKEPQKLGFFARIIQAIINFFRMLFGMN